MEEGDVATHVASIREAFARSFDPSLEPILTPSDERYIPFPIQYPDLHKMAKQAEASIWHVGEIKQLPDDLVDWAKLTPNERRFIKYILAFFAVSDGIVMENISVNFAHEVQVYEARSFYAWQNAIEEVHAETYGTLILTYVPPTSVAVVTPTGNGWLLNEGQSNQYLPNDKVLVHPETETVMGRVAELGDEPTELQDLVEATIVPEQTFLFRGVRTLPVVAKKTQWAQKWMDASVATFPERLFAFAIVEGVFFSSSFCAIFWLKKRGLMPGLSFSNQLISKDEGLHCDFALLLYSHLRQRMPTALVHAMMEEAIQVECQFVDEVLRVDLIGMNAGLMKQYVRFVADRLLVASRYPKLFHDTNPFDWMDLISLVGKSNFFERDVAEYAKSGVDVPGRDASSLNPTTVSNNARVFSLDEDF